MHFIISRMLQYIYFNSFYWNISRTRKILEKLSLTRTRIHGWTAKNEKKSPCFYNLQELYLDQCFWDQNLVNYMRQKIPNLRRLTIRSIPECRPSCTMLKSILQLRTIQYISIIDYPFKSKLHFSNSNIQVDSLILNICLYLNICFIFTGS
jgi:hypothetical protein